MSFTRQPESIEVFEFDARAKDARADRGWDRAVAPDPIGLNSVVALPEGGFASTNFLPRNAAGGIASIQAGVKQRRTVEWHTGAGWKIVPGSATSGANGIEISRDGKWFYMGGGATRRSFRFSRGQRPVKRDEVPVGSRSTTLRSSCTDGSLLGRRTSWLAARHASS